MHIHRTAHVRFFTTLSNEVLRDGRLSFCARGILAHLLSLPDGQRGDIRTLAERTPAEGRERVAAALRELERFGYLRRTVRRTDAGHVYTEVDVFDLPGGEFAQAEPRTGNPGSGALAPAPDGDHPVKERGEETTLPALPLPLPLPLPTPSSLPSPSPSPSPSLSPSPSSPHPAGAEPPVWEGGHDTDQETAASTDVLTRVARAEPRLNVGWREARKLAPLVTEWRRRGASDQHIIGTLTAGLPASGVYHPARFIETRLWNKMPAEPVVVPARSECDRCQAPLAIAGTCRTCREAEPAACLTLRTDLTPRTDLALSTDLTLRTGLAATYPRGAALARAAMRDTPISALAA